MALNWIGRTRYYSCEICCDEATVLDAPHGDYCQLCAERWAPFNSDEFFELLDSLP